MEGLIFDYQSMQGFITHSMVQELVEAIDSLINCLKLPPVIKNIDSQYVFRYSLKQLYALMNNDCPNQFLKIALRLTCFKLVFDMLTKSRQSEWKQQLKDVRDDSIEMVLQYTEQTGIKLKKIYCQLIVSIQDKKSETIEFFMFILFLAAPSLIVSFSQNSKTIKELMGPKIELEFNQISVWACMMVNYELTKINIGPQVYFGLKNKYVKFKRQPQQSLVETETVTYKQNQLMPQLYRVLPQNTRRQKTVTKELLTNKKYKPFFNEIHEILNDYKRKSSLTEKTCKTSKITQSPSNYISNPSVFNIFDRKPTILFGPSRFQQSDAFSIERKKYLGPSEKIRPRNLRKYKQKKSQFSSIRFSKTRVSEYCQKENISEESRKYLPKSMGTNQQSAQKRQSHCDINVWKQRLKHIRHDNNIERTKLKSMARNHAIQKRSFDHAGAQFLSKSKAANIEPATQDSCERNRNQFTRTFFEHAQDRSPMQQGIVEKISNFTNYSPQKTNQKNKTSRQFLHEYENFMKNVCLEKQQFHQEKDDYRLQKCLTGAMKL